MDGGGGFAGPRVFDPARWPLVGRDDELALAISALGDQGSVVLTGPAGVGKTRLAHEVLACVARSDDRTEWVAATQSTSAIPLGAVAHLIPAGTLEQGRDSTLRGIVSTLEVGEGRGRLIVGIDDAHLLDDSVRRARPNAARGGNASVVATVRSGERAPDAIVSLWKDGHAPLIALQTLASGGGEARHHRARGRGGGGDAAIPVGVERGQCPVPPGGRPSRPRVRRARARARALAMARCARTGRAAPRPRVTAHGKPRRRRTGRARADRGGPAVDDRMPFRASRRRPRCSFGATRTGQLTTA